MNKTKKILTLITIILIIFLLFLVYKVLQQYILKINFENQVSDISKKNENVIFEINKITFFSNGDAKNKNSSTNNFTLENLYQYTDIAIFIDTSSSEKTAENTFKKVSINNIKFNTTPTIGEPHLYFKGLSQFSKSEFSQDNIINDNLDFTITSEDTADLNSPVLYNNLANPITLSYVNSNIKADYTITDTSTPITYDGSLLKRCDVSLDSLNCNLSFDIFITNNKDEEFKCSVSFDIPLNSGDTSIYDGGFSLTKDTNFTFFRYK